MSILYRKKEGHPIKRGVGWDVNYNEKVGYWVLLVIRIKQKVWYLRWRQHAPFIYNTWEYEFE